MNKLLSFMAGALTGALFGAAAALLLTPASGQQLRDDVVTRWEDALSEAKKAMEETRLDMQKQFEQMQKGTYQEETESESTA
jgi:gas vesicle protein